MENWNNLTKQGHWPMIQSITYSVTLTPLLWRFHHHLLLSCDLNISHIGIVGKRPPLDLNNPNEPNAHWVGQ